jgi:tetratricopeptide (TPR) repeat protein
LLDNRPSNDPLPLWFVPQVFAMKGQFGLYRDFMQSTRRPRNPSWDLTEAFVLTSGAVSPDASRLETLLNRLEEADLVETRDTGFIIPHDDITLDFLAFENAFHRATILAQLGRLGDADELHREMKTYGDFRGLGGLRADMILSVEAEIELQRGNQQGALESLRAIRYELPHAASIRVSADGSRSRFLRAELEYAIGDVDVARGFYEGLDESWSPFDSFYRAPVYLRLAEIAESEGRIDDAIFNYSHLVEMWKDADSELEPARQSAKERLDVLLARQLAEPDAVPSIP